MGETPSFGLSIVGFLEITSTQNQWSLRGVTAKGMFFWWPHLFLIMLKDSWWSLSGSLFCYLFFFPLSFPPPPAELCHPDCLAKASKPLLYSVLENFTWAFLQAGHCNRHSITEYTLVVSSLCAVRYTTLVIEFIFLSHDDFPLNFFCLFKAFL